ncbi:MAG: hypothetical protein HYU66_26630 [Armatimonadetes bacterium]|nr:hypothetical protein [Armatimonadota bacterium]
MSAFAADEVCRIVEDGIARHPDADRYPMRVVPGGLDLRHECWLVVVRPQDPELRSLLYYDMLYDIERDAEAAHPGLDLLLGPTLPPDH